MHPMLLLFFSAGAIAFNLGSELGRRIQARMAFPEILYAYTSMAANNGSAFAGLSGNTPWWNASGGLVMLVGRYASINLMLALVGSMAAKKEVPMTLGTMRTDGKSVRRRARRHGADYRCIDLLPSPGAGADRGALRDVGRPDVQLARPFGSLHEPRRTTARSATFNTRRS